MHTKIHPKPGLIAHPTNANQPLNRLVRHVPKLTIKKLALLSKARVFAREYRLPMTVTLIFILVLSGVAAIRLSERASLAGLLASVSSGGQDYAKLLSGDKPDEFKKNEAPAANNDGQNTDSSPQPPGTPSSFTTNPNDPAPTPGNSGSGGNNNPPPPAFGAAIAYFQRNNTVLECANPSKPNKGSCSKKYEFGAGVRSSNGPGSVSYSWRSSLASANADGSFSAGSGTVVTDLGKEVVLACKTAGSYSMQFIITSPASVRSEIINFSHDCNDI